MHTDPFPSLKFKWSTPHSSPHYLPISFHFVARSTPPRNYYGLDCVPPKYYTEILNLTSQSLTVLGDEACIEFCILEKVTRQLLQRVLTQYLHKTVGVEIWRQPSKQQEDRGKAEVREFFPPLRNSRDCQQP